MDLTNDIITNLENKGYNDFTKIRWIYLYVCQMFSYDTRFCYADIDLKEKIYNKNINIANTDDFEIVCYTFARVLADALAEIGIKGEIIKEDKGQFPHAYVIVKLKDHILKLDPTKRYDVTRVKMHSTTLDFVSLSNYDFFIEELKETDEIINKNSEFVNTEVFYNNKTLKQLVDLVEKNGKERNLSEDELFYEKLEYIYCLINTRTDFKRYNDIDYYYSYLLKNFNINKNEVVDNDTIIKKAYFPVKPAVFFNRNDKTMKDIINISYIQYKNFPPMFYLIRKEGDVFRAREIYKDEAIELLREYHNPICQYMYETAALKLLKGKSNNIII